MLMAKKHAHIYAFELYILSDQLGQGQWAQLHKAIIGHLGLFGGSYELFFRCTDNTIRFFITCDHDLSSLSNAISGILLRPYPLHDIALPDATGREHLVQFVTGGNILDLKEKQHIQKMKNLEWARFRIHALSHNKTIVRSTLYFQSAGKLWSTASKTLTAFPVNLLAIDFATNTHYLKKTVPKYLNIEKSLHMLTSENTQALFEVDTFPYFSHSYFLNLTAFEFDKHSFIIGASGSGKSKFISLFVDRLAATALAANYRVIVIDPHASLANDFEHLASKKIVNFSGESTQLFDGGSTDISAATELTATLFKSLMGNSNAKLDRLLRFCLYVLFTAQIMSLDTLKRFLTEVELRNQILEHVREYVPANIILFFGADFNEMRTKYYEEALSPIISLVDEMQMQPALVGEGEVSLTKTIEDNFLTVFSLNKVSMGDKVVKTVAGLLIQQIFLLAQARAFSQKVILVIDEVSVVQNPALAAILAEARKFNLTVILTQQYFGQIESDLRAAIFANVYNYFAFKVSEEDARALEGNLNIELPPEIVEEAHQKGLKEQDIRIKIMTELHPRECLVRVLANGQVVPAVKARTMDAPKPDTANSKRIQTLKTYDRAVASLPKKFSEQTKPLATPSVDGADAVSQAQTISQSQSSPEQTVTDLQQQRTDSGIFNLSDLLAQHSSSRLKIKRKD